MYRMDEAGNTPAKRRIMGVGGNDEHSGKRDGFEALAGSGWVV
jgi:hypothetical protein